MASVMKEFEHLKIHLEEIKKATNSFSSKVIGKGGFGKVYEGEVSHSKGRSIVAIKRLNREFGQGDPEFLKEIVMLSRYAHKNLISLVGYCDEDGERILVYEHASNGSLDRHLSSIVLTWTKRLKICLDAARGLTYLHDHKGTQQRVLHRDIKSANILLDENWNAKLADMGLSKIGPANQQNTILFTNIVGTPGYCDPQYMVTYALTKESDIYSFGVVLFEVLCGRLCFKLTNNQLEILVPMWKHSYMRKKLDTIIFKDLIPSMDPASLRTFSDIAFQCLHDSREQRPTMSLLVKKLEDALKFQVRHEMKPNNDMRTSQTYLTALLFKGKGLFLGKKKRAEPIPQHAEGSGVREAEGSGVTKEKKEIVHLDNTFSFTVEDLLRGSAEVIGKSTYGTYYMAKLENGDHVAVYRLKEIPTKNRTEVEVELNFLGKIRHPNLLAMRAYFLDSNLEERLLIYDYISKESLATFLHANGVATGPKLINWETIMQIANGVARGLHSLHTQHHIIHGNLTPRNVILDKDINPKISDYGLSQLIPVAKYLNTYETGYQAPELSMLEKANTKTDIYSLGVILIELLTGKSAGEMKDPDLIPQWVRSIRQEDWITEVFDVNILRYNSLYEEGMLNVLKLAMDCVSELPHARPDIQLVLQQLEQIRSDYDDGGARSSLSK